jgi:hypothetical protein
MNIWMFFIGEMLPIDRKSRLWRYGILADMLAKSGYRIVHWAPTFNHVYKTQRYHSDTAIDVNEKYSIRLLYVDGYKKNISLQRIFSIDS